MTNRERVNGLMPLFENAMKEMFGELCVYTMHNMATKNYTTTQLDSADFAIACIPLNKVIGKGVHSQLQSKTKSLVYYEEKLYFNFKLEHLPKSSGNYSGDTADYATVTPIGQGFPTVINRHLAASARLYDELESALMNSLGYVETKAKVTRSDFSLETVYATASALPKNENLYSNYGVADAAKEADEFLFLFMKR